eukprot:TRINITY_DN24541_c0_g1_i1.p1 TRINITY_DN24541_c0_g1~~TRINITY_DN24541_c0_g1_i1.p1  ORF type:complete len:124 (+),score=1.10 TRINITY_DN24541_c0_g1_i1:2361-2732(+)
MYGLKQSPKNNLLKLSKDFTWLSLRSDLNEAQLTVFIKKTNDTTIILVENLLYQSETPGSYAQTFIVRLLSPFGWENHIIDIFGFEWLYLQSIIPILSVQQVWQASLCTLHALIISTRCYTII